MPQVTIIPLFDLKTKIIPGSNNARTVVSTCREYPEVIFIQHFWVCKIEDIGEHKVLRKGNIYALVKKSYEIKENTLLPIAGGLVNLKNKK